MTIELPFDFGDTVYQIVERRLKNQKDFIEYGICKGIVDCVHIGRALKGKINSNIYFKIRSTNTGYISSGTIAIDRFGVDVFKTKEEARAEIERRTKCLCGRIDIL